MRHPVKSVLSVIVFCSIKKSCVALQKLSGTISRSESAITLCRSICKCEFTNQETCFIKCWPGYKAAKCSNKTWLPKIDLNIQARKSRIFFQKASVVHSGIFAFVTNDSRSRPDKASSNVSNSYYLLWSRNMWQRIICGTLALLALRYVLLVLLLPKLPSKVNLLLAQHHPSICHNSQILARTPLTKVFQLVILLLSSACCAIQVLINVIAGAGCAGFNTYLGPIRPYFASLLLFSTIVSFISGRTKFTKWAITTCVSWFVALLPEIIHFANVVLNRKWQDRGWVQGETQSNVVRTTLEIDIPTMGCVACINKINASVRKSAPNNIIEETSWLNDDPSSAKGGRARVALAASSEKETEKLTNDVLEAIEKAGFSCKITSSETR